MKQVEYHRYWVTAPGRKRPYLTSFPMDARTAQERYPGSTPEPSTRFVREEPDTEEEKRRALMNYPSAGLHGGVRLSGKE